MKKTILWITVFGLLGTPWTALAQITPIPACTPSQNWTHLAKGSDRRSTTNVAPSSIDVAHLQWVADLNLSDDILFIPSSTPLVYKGIIYAHTQVYEDFFQIADGITAIDPKPQTGSYEVLWTRLLPISYLAWQSPAIDANNETLLIATGTTFNAIDLNSIDGTVIWTAPLNNEAGNASPTVTTDRGSQDRVFITDFGVNAKLYCINVDPFHAVQNPYTPGQIVWSAGIGYATGASPAYKDGVVYVAHNDDIFSGNGRISAYSVSSSTPIWSTSVNTGGTGAADHGFFGGITVVGDYVYAATYNFYGSAFNSKLVKLAKANGTLVWETLSVRTDSIPIVVGDKIYLAGGILGFGAYPTVLCYQDPGTGAPPTLLWDSYADTGGTLWAGGFTQQPIYSNGKLFVGREATCCQFYDGLYQLDTTKTPGNPQFIVSQCGDLINKPGSSPAISAGWLFSVGETPNGNGLYAFKTCPLPLP